jgi:hypothetical protein
MGVASLSPFLSFMEAAHFTVSSDLQTMDYYAMEEATSLRWSHDSSLNCRWQEYQTSQEKGDHRAEATLRRALK